MLNTIKNNRFLLIFPVIIIGGFVVVFLFNSKYNKINKKQKEDKLISVHNEAVEKFNSSIDDFATLVSGMRAYIEQSEFLPDEFELQEYVNRTLNEINYNDSIVVSYLDTNHIFIYSFTRTQIDPAHLVGTSAVDLRDSAHIQRLNNLMNDSLLHLFNPMNLVEGWPGIPLIFSVWNDKKTIGYIAPILNFSKLIEPVYQNEKTVSEFVFRFNVTGGPEFDRFAVYDGYNVYNDMTDIENYKKFDLSDNNFIFTEIIKYGLKFRIGTAYKNIDKNSSNISLIIWFWYFSIIITILIVFVLLLQSKKLNLNLKVANTRILYQNKILDEKFNEVKKSEIIIKEQHDKLKQLTHVVSNTDNAVMIIDKNGKIEWINDGFTKLYGYTLAEFTKKSNNIFECNTNPVVEKYIHQAINEKITISYEALLVRKDNSQTWVQTTWTPIIENEELIKLVAIDSNISNIKKAEQIIRNQNDDIKDSILYAKRIQNAILPTEEYISTFLDNYFILNIPRDIVSGDFYWISKVDDIIIFAAADCTGHGVPGAFMSLLGITYLSELNDVVIQNKITPAMALESLRSKIKISLKQTGKDDESQDGIDMALCFYDSSNKILEYAGAHSPVFLFRNNNQFIEVKPDRQPVGIYLKETPFTNHSIKIETGDCIYLFSDGYKDQTGGELSKKFNFKRFKDLFSTIHNLPMNEQKQILEKTHTDWKNQNEQLDDILIIGVRFD